MQSLKAAKPIHGAPVDPIIAALKKHHRRYTETAPEGCDLKVGDRVVYTNPQGVEFLLTVKGFVAEREAEDGEGTVYVFNDCWWLPVDPKRCRLARAETKR